MIHSLAEFETALEHAIDLMAEPPEPGSVEHETFLALLRDIEASRETIQHRLTQGPCADERAALSAHLAEYDRRYRSEEKLAHDHRQGEGLGQTFNIM